MTRQNRSQWDAGRFFQTLTYFEVIPIINYLQRIFTGNPNEQPFIQNRENQTGVVLVAGATGGVGKRVVRRLLERGYPVRALVRDSSRAKKILGDRVELFEADITIPETLTPELMNGVFGVICCTGTRVQPVEGDTPDREKYYQGIKFYLPEVVDNPEVVEYRGIKNLALAAAKNLRPSKKVLFDFTRPTADLKEIWGALDDVVMGGVSESNIRLCGNKAIFSGVVSTDNSGGFASIRTRNVNPPWNLSEYEGIELRVKGDGKRYKFFIRCEEKWDGVGYSYSFDTVSDAWSTIRIPFADLVPVFRAKSVANGQNFNASNVYSLQLMLSKFEYDGRLNPKFEPGFFSLEIESIEAYGGKPKPQFVMVSSAGVTRPGRPGIDLEQEPPAVRMNDRLGGILSWKLKGEDALRESGLTYTIIRPCALTEAPGDKTLIFDRGDNIKGQVSRESIAELCIRALFLPEAANKTFEVKEVSDSLSFACDWKVLLANLQPDRP